MSTTLILQQLNNDIIQIILNINQKLRNPIQLTTTITNIILGGASEIKAVCSITCFYISVVDSTKGAMLTQSKNRH